MKATALILREAEHDLALIQHEMWPQPCVAHLSRILLDLPLQGIGGDQIDDEAEDPESRGLGPHPARGELLVDTEGSIAHGLPEMPHGLGLDLSLDDPSR